MKKGAGKEIEAKEQKKIGVKISPGS